MRAFMPMVSVSMFLGFHSKILATKLPHQKNSECDEITPVFGKKTCLQVCDKKNGNCDISCNKTRFDSCDQTCESSNCGAQCNVEGYCLQNCLKGCKSSCNSGTCKQLCSNSVCDLNCSGRVCEQSCSKSACSMTCKPSVETCFQVGGRFTPVIAFTCIKFMEFSIFFYLFRFK